MKHTPYTFTDLARMNPGQLIEGIVLTENDGFALGTGWDLGIIDATTEEVPITVGLEYKLHLRDKILSTYVTKKKVTIYHTNRDALQEARKDAERDAEVIKFKINHPIGIFLGHIIRSDGVTFINILTTCGKDCWF